MILTSFPRARSALARTVVRRQRALRLMPLVLLLLVTGCASTPPAPPYLELGGSYGGSVSVQSEPLVGTLTLTQKGADLEIVLQFTDGARHARGEGISNETGFRGEVTYMAECPGRAFLEGRAVEAGRILEGTVSGTECGEAFAGTFRFTREG
jgi:hypothetical protein